MRCRTSRRLSPGVLAWADLGSRNTLCKLWRQRFARRRRMIALPRRIYDRGSVARSDVSSAAAHAAAEERRVAPSSPHMPPTALLNAASDAGNAHAGFHARSRRRSMHTLLYFGTTLSPLTSNRPRHAPQAAAKAISRRGSSRQLGGRPLVAADESIRGAYSGMSLTARRPGWMTNIMGSRPMQPVAPVTAAIGDTGMPSMKCRRRRRPVRWRAFCNRIIDFMPPPAKGRRRRSI